MLLNVFHGADKGSCRFVPKHLLWRVSCQVIYRGWGVKGCNSVDFHLARSVVSSLPVSFSQLGYGLMLRKYGHHASPAFALFIGAAVVCLPACL
ncbi:hypothetical protein D9M70_544420 [compost metagenome]